MRATKALNRESHPFNKHGLIPFDVLQFAIPVLMASVNSVNEIGSPAAIIKEKLFISWAASSICLYSIWKWNEFLLSKFSSASRSVLLLIFSNFIFIAALSFILIILLEPRWPYWILFVRFSVGTMLIVFIQYSLNSYRISQRFKVLNARLQMENSEARIAALEKHINPHFLFNALATLRSMIRSNDVNTEKFILNLSDVYRQLLSTKKTLVSVKEELDFLERYLFMLTSRFEDALIVKVEVSASAEKKSLPFLSIQLLVENCIKHNVISIQKPLEISVFQGDPEHISVRNNLNFKNSGDVSLGSGLSNLTNRYTLLGHTDGVSVENTSDHYTVTLKLLE